MTCKLTASIKADDGDVHLMWKMVRLFLTSCLLVALASGAAATTSNARPRQKIMLDKNFVLRPGQEALLADQKLKITFVSVAEDSRCPKGVNCIWAGNARVVVRLTKASGKPVERHLNTNPREEPGAESDDLGLYQIRLVSLDPYPVANKTIPRGSYAATLVVSKKS